MLLLGSIAPSMWFVVAPCKAETLPEAWVRALAVDPRLQAEEERLYAAHAGFAAARAQYRPRVFGNASYTFLSDEPVTNIGVPGLPPVDVTLTDSDFLLTGVYSQMPLSTGGRIRADQQAACARIEEVEASLGELRLTVKLEVAEAYVAVLLSQRRLEVARAEVDSLESHVRDVANMVQAQLVARNDLLASEVSLADARQRLIEAENAVSTAKIRLNRLLGRSWDAKVVLAELPAPTLPGDLDACLQTAYSRRPILRQFEARSRALESRAEAERAALRPQFDVVGGFTYFDNPYLDPNGLWALGFKMEWAPYDGGVRRARASGLTREAAALARTREFVRREIEVEVRSRWLAVKEALARFSVAQQALDRAQENVRIASRRFAVGAGTNTEVLDAVRLLTEANRNYYAAVYDAALRRLRLDRAIGIL
ncbi:TolC family protein [Thermostilla marina]